jgi:3-phenylpropionate/trans-cinnamate dioxygenase ferredoxin subunit
MADWTFVCNTSDVDFEDQHRFDHNDRTYCIYHLEDGFYATDGLCTHEDVHLVDGLIDGEEIECPMHLGVFNIKTGRVVMDPPCEDLKTYKIKVEDEKIFIEV